MVLERLSAIDRQFNMGNTVPPGYDVKPVKWRVLLHEDGSLIGVVDTADASARATRNGIPLTIPWNGRTTDTNPRLFVDNGEYMFGIPEKENGLVRALKRQEAYRGLLERYAKVSEASPVATFLESSEASSVIATYPIQAKELIAFEIDGKFPHLDERCLEFWASHVDGASSGDDADECMVCGQVRPSARVHPKILGIPKGQGAGLLLVSANEDAFLSYGRDQSLIAPTCIPCSQSYVRGLNTLLKSDRMHFNTKEVAYVFFTEAKPTASFQPARDLQSETRVDEALKLLQSPWTLNEATQTIDAGKFFGLSLTANSARAVVRTWIDVTIPQAKASLSRYYRLQRIIEPHTDESSLMRLPDLARAATDENNEKGVAAMEQRLLKLALTGGVLPYDVMIGAVLRCRAACDVSSESARLIKMVLASRVDSEDYMVQLDKGYRDTAYVCGRLFEVLAAIQRTALGETNSTVVNRYFGAASSSPHTVFPRLIVVAQGHFSRIERQKPGAKVNLEKELMEITDLLEHEFPGSLDASQQGKFALGFYHARADRFRRIRERGTDTATADPAADDQGESAA